QENLTMSMNMKTWVADTIANPCKKALPILSYPAIQLMGISVRKMISNSDSQAKAMALLAERFDTAASVSLMDLSLEAEAFGAQVRQFDNEVPTIIGEFLTDESSIESLSVPKVGAGRTGLALAAVANAVTLIQDRPVFAGVVGPFTLVGRLMGVSEAMMSCYDDPELLQSLLEKCTTFLTDYIQAFRATGANGVLMAEPLAGVLSPDMAEEFSATAIRRIIGATRTDEFAFIYHNCGNAIKRQAESIATLGADGYHFGNAVQMSEMLPLMPEDALVMGNIDASGLFRNGTPETIRTDTLRVLCECGGHKNFVISSGCDIPPDAPMTNINAFFDAVAEYYKQ
ncbi:MAG: uroporphyrinogen decarboxylase family protein, partial [Candidatus Sumerlaeales bacterium]|nr:uroporphyrinogen decarboxylase family protein [Candidatus Sumerlaeales bacterium]